VYRQLTTNDANTKKLKKGQRKRHTFKDTTSYGSLAKNKSA